MSSRYAPDRWRSAKEWVKLNRGLFIGFAASLLIVLVPLYGVLFPPPPDLAEHVLIGKLLWEKLAGVSHLDLEVSTFLGYRLVPFMIAGTISVFKFLGFSLIYLPKTIAFFLFTIHVAIITGIFHFAAKQEGTRGTYVYALVFGLPAVTVIYSASWFIGFINFTLGLSLVVLAIALTEWFLRDGGAMKGFFLFFCLLLAYMAHPFAPVFWIIWSACRGLMSVVAFDLRAEWKRFLILPFFYLPMVLYHYFATIGTELEPHAVPADVSPFVTFTYWQARMSDVWRGIYLQADDGSSGVFFGAFFIIFVSLTLVVSLFSGSRRLRAIMLTCLTFFLATSLIEEKFIPTPSLHWLAYEFRFYTAAAFICLTMSGVVLVRLFARSRKGTVRSIAFGLIGAFCVAASIVHLVSVFRAYKRFDDPAREYTAKVLNGEQPTDIRMPGSLWHPDGTFLSSYVCLKQPDCNPEGTPFHDLGGDLYVVKIRPAPASPPDP